MSWPKNVFFEILVLIAYAQNRPLNVHADVNVRSKIRSWVHLHPKRVCLQRQLDSAIKYQKSFTGSNTFRVSFIFAPWEIFHDFCRLMIFFFRIKFFEKFFQNSIRVANSLDPDQARRFVGPDSVWVQTVCKGYQQTTLRVKILSTTRKMFEHTLEMVHGMWLNFYKMLRVVRLGNNNRTQCLGQMRWKTFYSFSLFAIYFNKMCMFSLETKPRCDSKEGPQHNLWHFMGKLG